MTCCLASIGTVSSMPQCLTSFPIPLGLLHPSFSYIRFFTRYRNGLVSPDFPPIFSTLTIYSSPSFLQILLQSASKITKIFTNCVIFLCLHSFVRERGIMVMVAQRQRKESQYKKNLASSGTLVENLEVSLLP